MTFSLIGASHIGGRHHERNENNQDSFILGEVPELQVRYGVVLDGCGSSKRSEVSALYASFLAQTIEDLIAQEIPLDELPHFLFISSTDFLHDQIQAVGLNFVLDQRKIEDFVRNYWLFTVLAFIQLPEQTFILHRGDGVIRVNQFVYAIDEGNKPQYLAYFVIPWSVPEEIVQKPGFNVLTLETEDLDVLLLGTDGWNTHLDTIRTLEEKVESSEELEMYMNALAFNEEAFDDDATIVGLIRKE